MLRIGFDLDGVLADMDAALAHHADELFGPAPSEENQLPSEAPAAIAGEKVSDTAPLRVRRQLTERQRRRLWRRVRGIHGFWESLEETEPGVVSRLAALASERRWEVIFLTKRPATLGATAQIQSQRWLIAKGFELPSVYVVTGSRGLVAAALSLDIVVDDAPENCLDVALDSRARTIAVSRNPRVPQPEVMKTLGVHLVPTTADCFNLLIEIDETAERSGVVARFLRKMGFKPRTVA